MNRGKEKGASQKEAPSARSVAPILLFFGLAVARVL